MSGSPRVDGLFAGDPPPGSTELSAVLVKAQLLLFISLPLNLLGVPCWTGVPGALLTLWAYLLVDGQMHHALADKLPADLLHQLHRVKRQATALLVFCAVSFIVQAWLLSHGVGPLWAMLLVTLGFGNDS